MLTVIIVHPRICYRDQSQFVCMEEQHRVKIGQPGVPVAAAERG